MVFSAVGVELVEISQWMELPECAERVQKDRTLRRGKSEQSDHSDNWKVRNGDDGTSSKFPILRMRFTRERSPCSEEQCMQFDCTSSGLCTRLSRGHGRGHCWR